VSPTKQINASRLMGFLDLNISPTPHLDRLVVVIHEHCWRMLSMAHGPKVGSVVVHKRCDAITQYLERCVMKQETKYLQQRKKKEPQKGKDLMPRPIREKLV
jgi:hypothetical protein